MIREVDVERDVAVTDSAFLARKAEQQRPHLERLRERYGSLPIVEIPLFRGGARH